MRSAPLAGWSWTSLDPMYHFGSYFMPATERFLDGLLPWLAGADHDERISK